ncbi:MAG: hypothetical protein ABIF19_07760 [Planctomycetota bacterium]
MDGIKLTLLSVSLLLGGYHNALCAEVKHHGESYGYNLVFPSDWIQIPQDDMDKAFAAVSDPDSKHHIQYDAGFQESSATRLLEYPYVLVQAIPYVSFGLNRQIYESEFPKIIKAITGLDLYEVVGQTLTSEAGQLFSKLQTNKPHLDIARRRYLWELEMNIEGTGQVKGLCAGYFGRNSLVQVMFYSTKSNWDDYSDVRKSIIESFYFDGNQAYSTELASRSQASTIWERVLGKAIGGAVAGGLIALLLGIIPLSRRKRTDTEANMNTDEH